MLCASFYDIVHLWTINWVLYLDTHVHIQIRVPPNIDLICGFVLIFLCGLLSVPTIPILHNCFRQKSVHLRLPKTIFIFNTAVVTAVRAGQNFKLSKI